MFYKLWCAFCGRKIWIKNFFKKVKRQGTYIIVQFTQDSELIKYGNKYIDSFVKKNNLKKLILVLPKKGKYFLEYEEAQEVFLSKRKLSNLLTFYKLYHFTNQVLFFSINQPDSNKLGNMVSKGLISKEEAVAIGLYGLEKIME